MPRLRSSFVTWIVIIGFALVLRLAGAYWWQSRLGPEQKFYFGDSDSYWVLGQAIARGDSYEYLSADRRVFRTPGYPLLLAGLFAACGDEPPVMAARALNAVLGGLAVGIIGWWTTMLFDAHCGRIAGLIAAVYPGAIAMGAFVLTEAPFTPCMLAQLAFWSMARRAASPKRALAWAAGGGLAGAMTTLVRPSWLLFTPFALALVLALDRQRGKQLAIGLAMVGALVVCMLPWWIRNAHVTGRFVATTLQSGASLYDGLNPSADGSSNMNFVEPMTAAEHADDSTDTSGDVFEYRLDRRMAREAIEWARANPARVAQLAWIKFVRMWNVWPNQESFRSLPMRLIVMVTYVPLLVLGLMGAWRYRRCGWPYLLPCLPAVYLTLLHVIFVGSIRYREPAMLALVVLAAGVLGGLGRHRPPGDLQTSVSSVA